MILLPPDAKKSDIGSHNESELDSICPTAKVCLDNQGGQFTCTIVVNLLWINKFSCERSKLTTKNGWSPATAHCGKKTKQNKKNSFLICYRTHCCTHFMLSTTAFPALAAINAANTVPAAPVILVGAPIGTVDVRVATAESTIRKRLRGSVFCAFLVQAAFLRCST